MIVKEGGRSPWRKAPKKGKAKPPKTQSRPPNLYAAMAKAERQGGQLGPTAAGPARSAFKASGGKPRAFSPSGTSPVTSKQAKRGSIFKALSRYGGKEGKQFRPGKKSDPAGALLEGLRRGDEMFFGIEKALHGDPLSIAALLPIGKSLNVGKYVLRRNKGAEAFLDHTGATRVMHSPAWEGDVKYSLYDLNRYFGEQGPQRVHTGDFERMLRHNMDNPTRPMVESHLPRRGAPPLGSVSAQAFPSELFVSSMFMDDAFKRTPAVRHLLQSVLDEARMRNLPLESHVINKDLLKFISRRAPKEGIPMGPGLMEKLALLRAEEALGRPGLIQSSIHAAPPDEWEEINRYLLGEL